MLVHPLPLITSQRVDAPPGPDRVFAERVAAMLGGKRFAGARSP